MEILAFILIALVVIAIIVAIIEIPMSIAKARGITGQQYTIIAILSWCGLIVGVTWFIALIMSLVCTNDTTSPIIKLGGTGAGTTNNLEALEKLYELKEKGIITAEEYADQRNKLLGK